MPDAKIIQTNFTSGVLDPKLGAREDTTFYYNGLKDAVNLLLLAQGGVRHRPGKKFIAEVRPVLNAIDMSGFTLTAPEGGTASNVIDGDTATLLTTSGNIGTNNPFVVLHVDAGTAIDVAAIDVIDYSLSSSSLDDEFFVQYSTDNSNWFNFGTAFNWGDSARSRRRSADNITAQYFRVVRVGSTAIAATASINEIIFWENTDTLSNGRLCPFAYSPSDVYMMVATDQNIDVYTGATFQSSVSIPHTSTQLPILNWTQSLDTMIVFHPWVNPSRIFRQGADDEFDFQSVSFSNIPQYDYGAGVGGTDEIQVLSDGGTLASGDKFTILLDGVRTTTITAGTRAATATSIETALRALSNTSSSGISVTQDADGFTVTFGGDDGKQAWGEMDVSVLKGTSVWFTSRATEGEYPGEDIMSDSRGWPRCGLFHQSRLHLGGVPGVPDAHIMSTITDYYNLNITEDIATKGLMFRAETDQVGAIYNIIIGRHLTLFTNDGEFFYNTEAITEDSAPRLTTRTGSKEGTRVYDVDGALLFLQGVRDDVDEREIATSLREFLFVDTEQSYKAGLISKYSSHLIKNPVDSALRKALSTDEADIILLVNEDGTGVAHTLLRDELVNASMPIKVRDGDHILSVGVDKKRRVYFIVKRMINGVERQFLEMWDENLYLDCGSIVTMDYTEIIATMDGQDIFQWDFTNPALDEQIGVRINGGRLSPDDYSVDMGTKTITFNSTIADTITVDDVVRIASMVKQISNLSHLDGETVQTYIDGTQGLDYVINGGLLILSNYADTQIQYGFDFEVSGEMLPLRVPGNETLAGKKVRVVNAILQIYETSSVDIQANGGEWQAVPLIKTDSNILDRSSLELLHEGEIEISGLLGYAKGAPFKFRRSGPGPITVLGITREVSL